MNEHATDIPLWPVVIVAALCAVPLACLIGGAWLFGWRMVLIVSASYLVGNLTWAFVLALLRRARP